MRTTHIVQAQAVTGVAGCEQLVGEVHPEISAAYQLASLWLTEQYHAGKVIIGIAIPVSVLGAILLKQ